MPELRLGAPPSQESVILDQRRRVPELMDDPSLPADAHDAALLGLARINRWSAVGATLWPLLRDSGARSVLEIGSGGGDVLLDLARRARQSGCSLTFTGSDVSPHAVERAQGRADAAGLAVDFRRLDALADDLPTHDVLLNTLMLHHLDDDDARRLLAAMGRAAARLVVVCDLERSTPGLALAYVGTRLLSRSPVVHVDGPRSVRAAFTAAEARALALDAGLPDPRVQRRWPCRWLLTSVPS